MVDVQDSDDNIETGGPHRRPQFPRSNTEPLWPESNSSTKSSNVTSDDSSHGVPVLTKRLSALSTSSHDPPRRPARNPARSDPPHPKPKPILVTHLSNDSDANSTATGTKEAVTPWELFPAPESGITDAPSPLLHLNTDINPRATASSSSLTTSSSTSPVSSRPRPSQPSTGPVSDVTPWELYPAPPRSPTTDSTATSINNSKNAGSSVNTGRVEDVTPWELYNVPNVIPQRANLSTLATGPVEDVTPWDLFPSPTQSIQPPMSAPPTGAAEKTRSTLRVSASSNTGPGSSGKGLADLAHVAHLRRRKSTGAKVHAAHQPKARSNTVNVATLPHASSSANHSPVVEHSSPISVSSGMGISSHHRSATSSATSGPAPRRGLRTSTSTKSLPTTPKLTRANLSSQSQLPLPPPHAESANGIPSPMSSNTQLHSNHSEAEVDQRFSTADRTILEELKKNLQAREDQFKFKGQGTSSDCPLAKPRGKKHHALNKTEAPYPRSYEREVLDLDVWEVYHNRDSCESWTWHVFDKPPVKVLDLGCGTGTWILNFANQWRGAEFVGLDLVPIQPDLARVGSSELSSRITWVHHNFLEGLPFADEEFDYVHVKRIALGVPENKWDFLFEEITRVLKPNGAFEMFEEDLFFPGKLLDDIGDSEGDPQSPSDPGHGRRSIDTIATSNSPHSVGHETIVQRRSAEARESLDTSYTTTVGSDGYRHSVDTQSSTIVFDPEEVFSLYHEVQQDDGSKLATAVAESNFSSPETQTSPTNQLTNGKEETEAAELLRYVMVDYGQKKLERQASKPPTPSGNAKFEYPPMNGQSGVVTTPTQPSFPTKGSSGPYSSQASPRMSNTKSAFADSAVSLLLSSVAGSMTLPDDVLPSQPGSANHRGTRQRGYSMGANQKPTEFSRARNGSHPSIATSGTEPPPPMPGQPSSSFVPFLLRSAGTGGGRDLRDKAKNDPRDHSILTFIWEEMLTSRFINGSPLALLHNSLILYFKDVQSHPPLQIAFPPSSTKRRLRYISQDRDQMPGKPGDTKMSQFLDSPDDRDSGMDTPYDSDNALDVTVANPLKRTASYSNLSNYNSSKHMRHSDIGPIAEVDGAREAGDDEQISEDQRFVDVTALLKRQSKFMTLDDSRYSAYGPKKTRSLSTLPPLNTNITSEGEGSQTSPAIQRKLERGSMLPNPTMHLDQRQLNLHLALRTAEIVACAETMWEWVLEYQGNLREQKAAREAQQIQRSTSIDSYAQPRKSISSSITTLSAISSGPREQLKEEVASLSRKDYDAYINFFEAHMREHFALGDILEDRFGWVPMKAQPSDQQKVFEAACRNWDLNKAMESQPPVPKSPRPSSSSQNLASEYQNRSRANTLQDNLLPKRRERALTTSSVGSVSVPSSKRLSRSVRVFTAFKSEGPLFTDLAGHKKGNQLGDPSDQESINEQY